MIKALKGAFFFFNVFILRLHIIEWYYAHCAFIFYLILMITFVVFIFKFQSVDNINNSINNVYFFIRFTNNRHKLLHSL